jgi:hypothetical protein
MYGCSFAEDFRSLHLVKWRNAGTDTGTGNSIEDDGLAVDGNGYLSYDVVSQPTDFGVIVRFSASALMSGDGILVGNANLTGGGAADGFCIWADADGIKANHSDGVDIATELAVDLDYSDGLIHTVTYVVESASTHYLFVDALTSDDDTTSVAMEIGTTNPVIIGGDSSENFIGTISKVRIFDFDNLDVYTEDEHALYYADTLETFFLDPWAAYRCNSFCDDTDGNFIWDRTVNKRDITKADGTTSAKFPVIGTTPTDYYVFDGANDYVALPTLPTAYTFCAISSGAGYAAGTAYPVSQQHDDSTFHAQLTTEGNYSGYLHSVVIHSKVLTDLEKYEDEYQQMYWLWRGRAYGAYTRLITDDACVFVEFLDYSTAPYKDYVDDVTGTDTAVTQGGTAGCTFGSGNSNVQFPDSSTLECDQCSIVVYGTFTGSVAAGTIVDKGTNYKFLTNGNQLDFNGSTISHTFSNNEQIAVVVKPGFKPRFFVDGKYIGEGSTTETPDSTDTTVLNIGNNNEKNSPTQYAIKQVCICDKVLTDDEISALYEQASIINQT